MKSLYLRSGLALLCAVILSACGGNGSGDLPLQGSVSGLTKDGLVLINNAPNGEKVTVKAGDASFVFTKLAGTDEEFNITIFTQPTGAHCDIANNTGKANVYTYNRITVSCLANPWTLGGNVTGLAGKGLVLANGADTVAVLPPAVANSNVAFKFPSFVGDGALYGVTVLVQPEGQTCAVSSANNPGTMPGSDLLTLAVNCSNK